MPDPQISVRNGDGKLENVRKPTPLGRDNELNSVPVALSDEDLAKLDAILIKLGGAVLAPSVLTFTQTPRAVPATTSTQLIAANANRKSLEWMVVGTGHLSVAPGAVTMTGAGQGKNYSAPAEPGAQGGAETLRGWASQQAFTCWSDAGTSVIIWEA